MYVPYTFTQPVASTLLGVAGAVYADGTRAAGLYRTPTDVRSQSAAYTFTV